MRDPEALARGLALQADGRHAEALAAFERARAALPGDARPFLYAAASLSALDRQSAAFAAASQARTLGPELPEAHLAFAELAAALGAAEAAEAGFLAAIERAPSSANAWVRRGVVRLRSGAREAARADFEQALRLEPENTHARQRRDALDTPAKYSAWRPTNAAAALGLAVEYLCSKPAFARLPFGEWSQTLFWQTARKHYIFAVDGETRVAGFLGWALTEAALADAWVQGEVGLRNDQCLDGDCVIVNAWAADSEAVNAFQRGAAAQLFAGRRAVYFKRHYPDGRERALRLPVPRHRRTGHAESIP